MSTVTTDGARIGFEHDDHTGCSFPFLLVTATPVRPATEARSDQLELQHDGARRDGASAARVTDTGSESTTRALAE